MLGSQLRFSCLCSKCFWNCWAVPSVSPKVQFPELTWIDLLSICGKCTQWEFSSVFLLIECAWYLQRIDYGNPADTKISRCQAPHEKQCNFYPELTRIVLCILNHLCADVLYLMQCECYANSQHATVFSDWWEEKGMHVSNPDIIIFWIFLVHLWLNLWIWRVNILTDREDCWTIQMM